MLRISSICRTIPWRQAIGFQFLSYPPTRYLFSLESKKKQMILYSNTEIEKIHNKKKNKDKQW